ncbi:MAG TPA: hypothetical protein VI455_10545 [Terriglobia bacterium]
MILGPARRSRADDPAVMSQSASLCRFFGLERTAATEPAIADPAAEVLAALDGLGLNPSQLSGKRIAVAAGSRGIASLAEIVRAACQWLSGQGASPFVFPAMGSHGGATDEGQRQVLAQYGVTPDFIGAEIRSSMETVQALRTPEGFPVLMDRNAWNSDGVLVINRIKPHTRFSGRIESGLLKMIAIGMGKHRGALECHRLASRHGSQLVIRSIAGAVLGSGKILAGLALVENSRHQAAVIRAVKAEAMVQAEEELLVLAKRLLPRIPFSKLQLLIVDEIGKDVSGAGMDTNVIGRNLESESAEAPAIDLIYARDLTAETAGNALGVGLADLIHERLRRKVDFDKMYVNAVTSLNPWVARLPMTFSSDREALDFALRVLGSPDPTEQRVVSIRNTLSLDRILVSEALAAEAGLLVGWRVSPAGRALEFDSHGDLPFATSDSVAAKVDAGKARSPQ